jgi:hypothetical protein
MGESYSLFCQRGMDPDALLHLQNGKVVRVEKFK